MGTRGALRWKRGARWYYYRIRNSSRYVLEGLQEELAKFKTAEEAHAFLYKFLEDEETFDESWDGEGG